MVAVTVETLTPRGGEGSSRGARGARAERAAPDLRPRGVGRILDTSLDLFARRFPACAGIAALLWFPGKVAEYSLLDTADPLHPPLVMGIAMLVKTFTDAFVCQLVSSELRERRMRAGEAVLGGLPRLPGLLVLGVAAGTLSALAWICCLCTVVPVVPLLVLWLFAVVPAVYVLERTRVTRAVERGVELVRGGFLRWLGWFATANLMVLPLTGLTVGLDAPEARIEVQEVLPLGDGSYLVLAAVLSSLFVGIASAYTATCMTVYYVDARARREGFDLFVRLDRAERA